MVGNLVDYPVEVITPTLDLTTVKIYVNIVISDIISCYMGMDVKDLYLNNRMYWAEYIMIQTYIIPEEFMIAYNLK